MYLALSDNFHSFSTYSEKRYILKNLDGEYYVKSVERIGQGSDNEARRLRSWLDANWEDQLIPQEEYWRKHQPTPEKTTPEKK